MIMSTITVTLMIVIMPFNCQIRFICEEKPLDLQFYISTVGGSVDKCTTVDKYLMVQVNLINVLRYS